MTHNYDHTQWVLIDENETLERNETAEYHFLYFVCLFAYTFFAVEVRED
jgi:hypothetical protein